MAGSPRNPLFISVEGIEGSGKSTLIAGLAARFSESGVDFVTTREPGGTPLGDRVRALFLDPDAAIDPLAETFLLNASRAQLVADTIAPALAAARTVLCDRFVDATIAYQGYGRGLDLGLLRTLCDAATGGLMPSRTLLVDLPVETAFGRLAQRGSGRDRVEREGSSFHERVRAGYLALAASEPRITVLDGTLPAGDLLDAAWAAIAAQRTVPK
jgi:dTMP kinase